MATSRVRRLPEVLHNGDSGSRFPAESLLTAHQMLLHMLRLTIALNWPVKAEVR